MVEWVISLQGFCAPCLASLSPSLLPRMFVWAFDFKEIMVMLCEEFEML